MAGLGRRSHYRKHLTDAVLNDLPEPDETLGQRIARVSGTRGGNMFDIVVAPLSASRKESSKKEQTTDKEEHVDKIILDLPPSLDDANRTQQLAFLPTKFRKLVWIKRNDFVIVQCGEEESTEQQSDQKDAGGSGFRYVITHILYKDQVKHIKSKGLWPDDPYFADEEPAAGSEHNKKEQSNIENVDDKDDVDGGGDGNDNGDNDSDNEAAYEDDDGIVFDDPLDDDYMINTNRVARLTVDDSSSDEDSD
jgi:probable RNA-binding protein EIF1AD